MDLFNAINQLIIVARSLVLVGRLPLGLALLEPLGYVWLSPYHLIENRVRTFKAFQDPIAAILCGVQLHNSTVSSTDH